MSVYAKGGYLDQKTRSSLSLVAAIAVNGGAVAALLLINPTVITEQFKTFRAIPIASDPPPPPPPEVEPQKPLQKAPVDVIAVTKSPVVDPSTDFTLPLTPLPQLPPLGGTVNGGGTEIAQPPHLPVFKGSQIDPRYAALLQPPYPPGKIRAGEEGVVVVRVLVGPDGRVKEVQKVEAADEVFFRATAEQAMKRWRFTPATSDGAPVESWRTMTVRFKLDS